MSNEKAKQRLWIYSVGPYPRRVMIYLAEKGIADKFDIISVEIGRNGMEDPEGKPPGTLPILELQRPTAESPGRYVFQSTAILEYLEDVYGSEGPDMRGQTAEARARMRECMDVANEAVTWFVLYVQNGSSLYAQLRPQQKVTAEEGSERMHKALSLLEKLADPKGPFLVGETPTLVDCVLMAAYQFGDAVYHVDIVTKHPRLRLAVEEFARRGTAIFPELPDIFKQMKITMSV